MAEDKIEKLLETALGMEPARAGMRLKSERELSSILRIGRMKIHRTIARLAEKGILQKKHGSGTYVRKISDSGGKGDPILLQEAEELSERLFAETTTMRSLPNSQRQLNFGLWGDLQGGGPVNRMIVDGISKRVAETGNKLSLHEFYKGDEAYKTADDVARELKASPCDGYLVIPTWAETFRKAFSIAFGDAPPPMAYIYPASFPVEYEPMVVSDTRNAMERAIMIFKEEGFTKIGMLFNETPFANLKEWQENFYRRAVALAGLSYTRIEYARSLDKKSIDEAVSAILTEDPPEAVYVADDHLMPQLDKFMRKEKIVPGRDIRIIALSNYGMPLPAGYEWSRMEFHPEEVGIMAVECLLRVVSTAGRSLCSFSHRATWLPGKTHLRK